MFGYTNDDDELPNPYIHRLTFRGEPVSKDEGIGFSGREAPNTIRAQVLSERLCSEAITLTFRELTSVYASATIEDYWWDSELDGFYLGRFVVLRGRDNTFRFGCAFEFAPYGWKHPWTMVEHAKAFISVFEAESPNHEYKRPASNFEDEDLVDGFTLFHTIVDPTSTIEEEIETLLPLIERVHKQTINNLSSQSQTNSVVVRFDFPEETRIACEQYLLYFVQFLSDIGIEATADLREDAGNVLFSVTPKDKEEALENIRMALGVYLQLPSNPNVGLSTPTGNDIEVQRLSANIYHLNGQLALAGAVIQQKDVLIQQQQALINGRVLIDSIQTEQEKEADKEPIVGDIISIKKFEWNSLEVDLPTLLRRLKQRFGRKKLE